METKKVFFASDFHLGLKAGGNPIDREKRVVGWLKKNATDARAFYLLGDVFDFWWEYKLVVPRGFTRFLGTLSELTDSGMPVHLFTGNHDLWMGKYLSDECGVTVHNKPLETTIDGKSFYLAHGEGLGTKDPGYRILLSVFRNKTLQKAYSALHPSIGVGIGHRWSLNSRLGKGLSLPFLGEEKEDLFRHTREVLKTGNRDYFIYGHRHLPLMHNITDNTVIAILGDWISRGVYAEWNGAYLVLKEEG
jgi:UDP-2,3-diacylglucosamine hydrolase